MSDDDTQLAKDEARLDALMPAHTYHCAARIVWGDGECTCPGDGTGTEYHTMNPPPGGFRRTPNRREHDE